MMKKYLAALLALCLVLGMTACGQSEGTASVNTGEVAGEYYLDLTELGMKLTVYLRLDDAGNFLFSNTLAFETDKSSGTFQKSGEEYIMVFTSVNGEERSISDGLTSGFVVQEDGSLDFSGGNPVPYGSANIDTVSDDDPSIKLLGIPVSEGYEEPETASAFRAGVYTTEAVTENGVAYSHAVSFYEDNTYLHVMTWQQDGQPMFDFEMGTYGISTTQLALEAESGDHSGRVECEVVDGSSLKLSILPYAQAGERTTLDFTRTEQTAQLVTLSGTGTVTGTDAAFDVTVQLYADGTYTAVAAGYTESGLMVLDTRDGYMKQYPDHPETQARGLSQVATVPYGACGIDENGSLTLTDLRVCTSESLTRYKCTVTE